MARLGLTTFKDVVDQMTDFLGTNAEQKAVRDAKRAVLEGYRELAATHPWSFLRDHLRLNVVAPYETGTITYDHTGGSSERLVTLASGTFPTWATYGTLRIADVDYEVDEYLTATTLTLTSGSNPGADVAAGTAYTLYRDTYSLPNDFIALNSPKGEDFFDSMEFVSAGDWLANRRVQYSAGDPSVFCIFGDPNVFGGFQIGFWPTFSTAQTIDAMYVRQPRDLKIFDHKDGTVEVTSGSAAVTGTSTNFTSDMVGSVLRLSGNATEAPTALWGENAYVQERTILAYTSATSIRVDAAFTAAYSGVKYNVSDPVDLQREMMNAFLRCCERQLALMRMDAKVVPLREQAYAMALKEAKAADNRYLDFAYLQPRAKGWYGPDSVTNAAVGE